MRTHEVELLIASLELARRNAIVACMDEHFVSDINHLIATAKHNGGEK